MADSEAFTLKKSEDTLSDPVESADDIGASGAVTITRPVENTAFKERLPIGGRFRDLRVHSKLGEGATGAAYLASHPLLQLPLVIKTFKATLDSNIFREAHLAARVVSPNVVSVMDAGYEFDVPFVIQRYIDGIDLDELITQLQLAQWQLPVNMICRILIDGANGLHAIHQAGIIHRDVKPANLFLRGNGVSTVGDFGIAIDPVKEQNSDHVAGTPSFMAPEQWYGKQIGRHTDIYALGATGHLLATGLCPFEERDISALRTAHLERPYKPPTATEPGEAYLFSVIARALRKLPAERFSNAAAMARTLAVVAEPMPELINTTPDTARVGNLQVELAVGDLAAQESDVIVSAANKELTMKLGVANVLRQSAGDAVEREAAAHAPAAMGDVIWTRAGKLRARWIAHAVAAIEGAVCLQRATLRVLLGAEVRRARSVVFPALGTGVGEVPMDLAAKLMLETIRTFAALQPRNVTTVRIVLYKEPDLARWRNILQSM
jgi:O-acetyl-ADP-ribose deacetylase (regulator of RNase III)